MINTPVFYEPIREELEQVSEKLSSVATESVRDSASLLGELLDHILEAPGKGTRPALTLLASRFHPHDHSLPVVMGAAVELLHIATLIHDDMVDNSPVRRGKATVSSQWGKNVAVLLGDYVFATSATFVCETGNVRVIRRFSETIMELSSGELSEISTAFDWRVTRELYWKRIYEKTASLFCTAAESGAVLSGAPEDTVQALRTYGYNIGLAFQIVDDILDFQGTEEEIGKPVGNDLLQGIVTLPSILLMERYPDENPVRKLFEDVGADGHLQRTLEMVQNLDIIPETYAIAQGLHDKAVRALEPLPDSIYKRSLLELAAHAMERRR